jgi:hypothetical protein
VWASLDIHGNRYFSAGHFLASSINFFFSTIAVFHALSVHDQQCGLALPQFHKGLPPIALQLIEPFKEKLEEVHSSIVFNSSTIKDLIAHLIRLHPQKIENAKASFSSNYDNWLRMFSCKQIINNGIEWVILDNSIDKVLLLLPPLNPLAHVWIQQTEFFNVYSIRLSPFSPSAPNHPGASVIVTWITPPVAYATDIHF